MKTYTLKEILAQMKIKGYKVFSNDRLPYNLNLIAIRSKDLQSNTFNDTLHIIWKYDGIWNHLAMKMTTDPGVFYREHPMNVNGTAILVPGQYLHTFALGLYHGYTVLRQKAPMRYWRDNDKNVTIDILPQSQVYTEIANTHIHHAGVHSTQVDKWSAGCQVLQHSTDLDLLVELCKKAQQYYQINKAFESTLFSYTLLDEWDQ